MGERARKGGSGVLPLPLLSFGLCAALSHGYMANEVSYHSAELANSSVTVISVYVDLPHVGGGGSGGWGACLMYFCKLIACPIVCLCHKPRHRKWRHLLGPC